MGAGVDQPFPIRHQADMARKEDEVAAPEIARRHLLSKRRRLLVAVARRKDSAQAERKLDKAGALQPSARVAAPQYGLARPIHGNRDKRGTGTAREQS